ncbi:hypothetical protein GGR95_001254 [Sulfitobacter undariae]|uniref:Uncharacterized protein n=1 Tax=Sulfitobacter undariae TaxID=1563671 RepID=A0A7W6E2M7_9RHOB|nr:hypothetical protein [Sulfitobacter undariae]
MMCRFRLARLSDDFKDLIAKRFPVAGECFSLFDPNISNNNEFGGCLA